MLFLMRLELELELDMRIIWKRYDDDIMIMEYGS